MATKRITKAMYFTDICSLLQGKSTTYGVTVEDAVDFCHREVELVSKKNSSGTRKPTATQKENEGYKALILDFLALQPVGTLLSCSDIRKAIPELGVFENQKTAALLAQLVKAGKVVSEKVKGKAMFSLPEDSAEDED